MSNLLRPYQAKGEAEIFQAWREGNQNVMYQLVTGGGKTVLFVDIIKKFMLAKKRVILLAHREELINQAWEHLYKNSIMAGIIKADIKPNYSLACQVASIQTCARRKALPAADVVIFDEAHHCQDDNSYGNLLMNHYPRSYGLGVTATPYRLGGKGFTNMFNKLITGPSFKELVEAGYLTPLRYFVASIPDLSKVKIRSGDYDEEQAEEVMKLAPLVESYFEHCAGMRGVVFAVNVHHSNIIVEQYNNAGVRAAHLDAKTPPEIRKAILKAFKSGEIRIISNVGIITEGFDFPDMEFVQLARPTKSLSLFLQMVGRVTRTDYSAIKDATDDEVRRYLVSQSKKPFGFVLDNAGLYQEHGLPDIDRDWNSHFIGYDKKKKKLDLMIEMIEFVAEDDSGRQVRTKNPLEVEGMKLIEVNKTIREKIVNLTSLKEFDRLYEMFKAMANKPDSKMNKPGFVAYGQYKEFCRKSNLLMSPEVWDYLIKRLSTEPRELRTLAETESNKNIDMIKARYQNDPDERARLIDHTNLQLQRRLAAIKRAVVPEAEIRRDMANYLCEQIVD